VSDLLVIPSAQVVAPELEAEFGPIPPALIPLDGRPAMRYVLDAAPGGTEAVIAAHDGIELLREALERTPGPVLVDVGRTSSLGATIAAALAGLESLAAARLVVNFADTFVPDLPATGDAIAYRVQEAAFRWTSFELDTERGIGRVVEKGVDKGLDPVPVFVGVFAFADPGDFTARLAIALREHQGGPVDPFYVAVAEYVRARGPEALFEPDVWHDFGHLDTYYRTRQRLFIDRRAFNDVEVDARRGVIRKRSTNLVKLARERDWYQSLPPGLGQLAPRVLSYSEDHDHAWLDMEFYGYPPLADAYLYGAWDIGAWSYALASVEDAAATLHAETLNLPDAAVVAVLRSMYEEKTDERLSGVLADDAFAPLRGAEVAVNGERCLGLDGALELLPELSAALGLCEARPLGIVHGDLCLSNILYDRRNGIVRLIDPRGDFGGLALHGDPLYDHAKLAHSIDGDYDHLVRGLFDLDLRPGAVDLEVHLTARQREVKRLHAQRSARVLGDDRERVRLVEALLFLTMVPLHADRPRAQVAFLARGLGLMTEVAAAHGLLPARVTKIAA
jgi:hypothetical protein